MFSIVIPLYNKENTICRTLSSILTQTLKTFEIIIVDDGSTDNGVSVIKNFSNDERIRILHQQNQGVSAARNFGVSSAKYNYIAFIDGDDEWMSGFLEYIKKAIVQFPNAGMYGTASWHQNFITGEGSNSTLLRYKGKIQQVDYFENPGTMSHTSATVVSKKIFNKISKNGEGFPVGMKLCEDWSCFYRIAFLAPVVYIGFPLGVRNNNVEGQITGVTREEKIKMLTYIIRFLNLTYKSWVLSGQTSKNYVKYLKYDIRHKIVTAIRSNDSETIIKLLNGINKEVIDLFSSFELFLYSRSSFKLVAILYIYITKIIWRNNGFPVVGKNK